MKTVARSWTKCVNWGLLVCVACVMARAQDTQFLPEIDTYIKLSPIQFYIEAKDDRDGGDSEQFTFGPSIQVYLKPMVRLQKVTLFDLDDQKSRPLVVESGYRIITAPNSPGENRAIEAVTSHLPLPGGILLSDRNRADLDWKSGVFSWRYRNKLTIERSFSLHSFHLTPYLAAEPFYESQYSKWSTTDLYAGCLFPVGKHIELNPYYEHENDTGKHPNRQNHYFGLALYLYFSPMRKSP